MTVRIAKPAINLREELVRLRTLPTYREEEFYFDSLVENGTFDSDTIWTLTGGSITGGEYVGPASGAQGVQQNSKTPLGTKRYKVQFDASVAASVTTVFLRLGSNTNVLDWTVGTTPTTFSGVATAGGVSELIYLLSGGANTLRLDNITLFEVDANGDVIHTMKQGWLPKYFFEDGLKIREGVAHDYEAYTDGFRWFVKPSVTPGALTETCIIGVKA